MFQFWLELFAMSPKRVVQDVYIAWQSSAERRRSNQTQDKDWLQYSHSDWRSVVGKHWNRFFPTSAEALDQKEPMICARARLHADFTYSICQKLSPQQEAQYVYWLLYCSVRNAHKEDWHTTLSFWRIVKFELLHQPMDIPSRVANQRVYINAPADCDIRPCDCWTNKNDFSWSQF